MNGAWLLPAALDDVEAAWRWYETQRPGLGDDFVDAVDSAMAEILEFPDAFPVVHRGTHRYLLVRSPYCLYYRVEGDGVVVVACLHAALDPRRHRRRLRG